MLRVAASRVSPSARRLPAVDARLSLASLASSHARAPAETRQYRQWARVAGSDGRRARPRALWALATASVGGGASLWLSLGPRDAQCAPWSPSPPEGDKKKPKEGEEDLLEQLMEQLRARAGEALAAAAALAPGDLGAGPRERVDAFLASGKGGQVTWGFAMGVCSGFALKKVSKVGAVALGALFVAMQCASYSGYVAVDYQKLERDVTAMLDLNKDGRLDIKDADTLYQSVMKVLEFSLPAGSGYAVGFLVGFRAG